MPIAASEADAIPLSALCLSCASFCFALLRPRQRNRYKERHGGEQQQEDAACCFVVFRLCQVWDKEYYEAKAKEKAAAAGADEFLDLLPKPREKPKPPPLPPCGYRQQLQQRTFQLDFEREVGKTKMVTLQTPRMQQGG